MNMSEQPLGERDGSEASPQPQPERSCISGITRSNRTDLKVFSLLGVQIAPQRYVCLGVWTALVVTALATLVGWVVVNAFLARTNPGTHFSPVVKEFDAPLALLCWKNATPTRILTAGCADFVHGGVRRNCSFSLDDDFDVMGRTAQDRQCVQFNNVNVSGERAQLGGENASDSQLELWALLEVSDDGSAAAQGAVLHSALYCLQRDESTVPLSLSPLLLAANEHHAVAVTATRYVINNWDHAFMWPTTHETDNYTSTVASSLRVTDGLWYQPLPDPLADYSPSIESYIPDELRLRDISANRSLRAFRATMYSPNGVVLVVEELNPTNWPELGSIVLAYLGVTMLLVHWLFPRRADIKAEVVLHPTAERLAAGVRRTISATGCLKGGRRRSVPESPCEPPGERAAPAASEARSDVVPRALSLKE